MCPVGKGRYTQVYSTAIDTCIFVCFEDFYNKMKSNRAYGSSYM